MRQGFIWAGSGFAAVLVTGAAVVGLRGFPPPVPRPQQATAVAPPPAAVPANPAAVDAAPGGAPGFDIVKIDRAGNAVIAGWAAPGARVRVLDGSRTLGEVTADGRGEWVLVPDAPIPPGERQLSLEATDPHGRTLPSTDSVALSVLPASPGGGNATLAVLLPGNAQEAARVLQRPQAAADGALSLDTVEYDGQGRLVLSGRALPSASLNLYAGDRRLATAIADAHGNWSSVSPRPALAGRYQLRVDELAANGSVVRQVARLFEPAAAPAVPAGHRYVVKRGNNLWLIARRTYGDGFRYMVIYSANRGHIHNPNIIYPGQTFTLPKS